MRAAVLAAALAVAAAPAPQRLSAALLAAPYPDSQLPGGFRSATVAPATPPSGARREHVLREVEVDVRGPDLLDGVAFLVFPSAADARADLAHPGPGGSRVRIVGAVPGYAIPSVWMTGSASATTVSGKTVADGLTVLAVAKGNVLVVALTALAGRRGGDAPAALALLRSGLRHLETVRARLRGRGPGGP